MIDTYKKLCTEFYDLHKPDAPEDALQFYINEIENSTQPVLEPMCGTGRFLIPLLELGFDIEGTDASSEMLAYCRKKSYAKNLSPVLYFQKLQELVVPKKYGIILIPAGSFGLITNEYEVKQTIKMLFRCLLPGGKLIIEISTPYVPAVYELNEVREARRNDHSKIILKMKTTFDTITGIESMYCEYQDIINGEVANVETEVIRVRNYSIKEFTLLFEEAGFTGIEALKLYSGKKADEADLMAIMKGTVE